jgi:dihydropteroate synthase
VASTEAVAKAAVRVASTGEVAKAAVRVASTEAVAKAAVRVASTGEVAKAAVRVASTEAVAKVDLVASITLCRFGGRLIIIILFNNLSVGSISVNNCKPNQPAPAPDRGRFFVSMELRRDVSGPVAYCGMRLRACDRFLDFPTALVMGIINVTPDSFSDGGRFVEVDAAVAHGHQMAADGASLLDIGGESTRPGAEPVSESEELCRVIPVIERLKLETELPLSIDTQKPAVARKAIAAGAVIINDIAANRENDAMWRLATETGAGYIAMHMQGTPQTMQAKPCYDDVTAEVEAFFIDRLERLAVAGVAPEQVALDPGIGFGKTSAHNLELLANLGRFTKLARPLVLGASRKSFLGALSGSAVDDRLPGSLACACHAVAAGVRIIRTHDVCETVQAIKTTEAIIKSS